MRTKRKRATRKPPARKPPALPQNEEACSNFVAQNSKPASVHEAPNEVEVDQYNSTSSSSSSSTDSDESFKVGESSCDDLSIGRRSRKSAKSRGRLSQKSKIREIENPVSSAILRSSGKKQNHLNMPHDESHYNSKELKAASLVIETVMRMEEAQPFGVPVDPVALGRPDYFDIVHTPMDFGTIARNLQNSIKYKNSRDVYNDVEYIWENCLKLYNKGEYIVYLMKRVRKKFMKYWTAAGLDSGHSRKSKGNSDLMPGYAMRHSSRFQPLYPSGHAVEYATQLPALTHDGPYHLQKSLPSSSRLQLSQTPFSNSLPYQLQHPPPSTHELQFLQSQTSADCNGEGYTHHQPQVKSAQKHNQLVPGCPVDHLTGGPASGFQPYKTHLSRKQPSGHQLSLRPSQFQAAANTGFSGHVPGDPVDPMVVEASQLPSQPSQVNYGHFKKPSQLQASCVQPQSSRLQTNLEIENSHLSLTDSTVRGINCALRYSLDPGAEKPNQENLGKLCPSETAHEESPQSQHQPCQSQRLTKNTSSRRNPVRKRKNVRGSTACPLSDVEDEERIFVPLNDLGQPVGPEALKLSSFLGTIARNGHMAPLNYVQWKLVPKTLKEDMWQLVQTKFDIDSSCKTWMLQSIGNRWRNWKRHLKATYFDPHETDEERLKNRDERILPEQWSYLVSYWNTDKAKRFSIMNKAIGKMQKNAHAAGRKSFAVIREEERQKRPDGKEPTRAELYIITHTRKDGKPVNETAATTIAKLREKASKKQKTVECSNNDNDTFCEVMGELNSDQMRTYGPGREPAQLWGKRPSRRDLVKMVYEVKRSVNEEATRMSDKIEALEQKYASIETQIGTLNSNVQKILEKIYGPTEEVNDSTD